ncbi:helix-turn-helix transcriptional regulator [Pleurocapsa sp. PCC 7319]|uniref:helix-turn-helix domain-containing protein n=1 Tax=Pleurocapsa sp. PCC 7319 TaxID=118161 RepID=UPI0003450C28|nr:helix-turn-helix transcriptional regulator [Pleurocapsa sp. PCC 7319]
MIQNEHQYKVTQNKLKDLEQALVELLQIKDTLRPRQFSSRKNGLQLMIGNLSKEIEEYNALKQQQTPIKIASIQELPLALIRARIAMGMTQKELAEKMGVKEQQVQRDEANQYSSAGFQRISAVAEALDIKIQETSVLLKS